MTTKKNINDFKTSTKLTILGRNPDEQHGFVNPPLYRGSTVIFNTVEDLEQERRRFDYGTAGTPTIENLEKAWTSLTGGAGTVLSSSGLGAVTLALLSTTKSGDHILIPDSVYQPTRRLCDGLLARFGVSTTYYDPLIGSRIIDLIQHNTSTIFVESPGSKTMEIQDIPAIVKIAKSKNIKTILDNSWATPLFFDAHAHGVDLSVEAGTKYLSGHSDILLGLVSANAASWPALRETYDAMSMLPGAEDCLLALRGLRTMHLRLKEVEKKAINLASWLKDRPEVAQILHPAFKDCPGHEFWTRDFSGSSGLFSIILKGNFSKKDVSRMLDGMSIFSMGYSWGGYESLIIPFDCRKYRTATNWSPVGPALRLQIGLEDLDDLKEDLAQGFFRLTNNV